MTARWQDDPERAARVSGHLEIVRDARVRLEAGEALLGGELDDWMRRRQENIVVGARKGLDGAIGMAIADRAQVPNSDLAAAADVDREHVERVRARLKALGTTNAPPGGGA